MAETSKVCAYEQDFEQEGTLLLRAMVGETDAWADMVERFSPMLWRTARAFRFDEATSADIVQTCWLALAEHGTRVRDARAVRAWLASTAYHACLHELRRRRRVWPAEEEVGLDVVDPGRGPDERVADADRDARLWRAVGRLPARDQVLLSLLTATPPLSYAEIAEVMDLPIGSIGPTRGRCLQRLRAELVEEGITHYEGH